MSFALEFEYTFKDYLEASRTHSKRRRLMDVIWWFIAAMFAFAAVFTLVGAFWHEQGPVNPGQFGGLLVAGLVLFLWSPLFFRLMARNRWKLQPHLQKKINYEITPEVVRVTTETSRAEMTWASFTRFVESKNLFLLYPNRLIFHMIPKRAFASPDELESFRELATSKIPPAKHAS